MRFRRSFCAFAAAFLALAWPAPQAEARGALALNGDVCFLFVGPDYMFFSGYQPAKPRKKFCEDVPDIGETVFAMDFAQDEMREMKIDVRILRDIGDTEERQALDAATLVYLPPQIYPAGSINLRRNFTEAGDYAGIVTADGPNGEHWVARFPFAVGRHYSDRLPYYLLAAAGVLALILFSWSHDDRRRAKKPTRE